MKSEWKFPMLVLALICLGGGLAAYKSLRLGVPFWMGEQSYDWQIEARVSFLANGERVKARLALPPAAASKDAGQESGSLGYHYNIERDGDESDAVWSAENREGGQALYFRVRLPESIESGAEPVSGKAEVDGATIIQGPAGEAARAIVARLKSISSDPDSLFVALFEQINDEQKPQEFVLLKKHYAKEFMGNPMIRMGIDLLEMAGVPARMAYGVSLNEDRGSQAPLPMVEYFDGAAWKVRDPSEPGVVPNARNVFVWHRGEGPLLDVNGGENSRVTFTVVKDRIPLASLTVLRESPLLVATILGLPLSERAVFRYIVLIPLGAFVVVVMRNLVGMATLGTFMPVLLALAFLQIPLGRGLVMFGVLIGVGVWLRFMLSRLNLLVVPRVAACVVIVTLLMMLMSVVSYRLGITGGVQITLFPMIILAWTIERMSLIWEEEGRRSALVQVGGSLVVAVLAYLFMRMGQIQHWAFYFPELLLVLLAGILMIGRYTGYRISELFRFRTFAGG